jgi:very-short-patch-repair endonuclease
LLDLAAGRRRRDFESAIERSERLGLLDLGQIDSLLGRCGGHAGKNRLRGALALYRDPGFVRSWPERKFLALVRDAGLPRPATNIFVEGHEIDAYWEHERFAVEVDGYETHRTRRAFEDDRLRQEDLKLKGIDSIRITARRIEREPALVATRLRALLERRRRELRGKQ